MKSAALVLSLIASLASSQVNACSCLPLTSNVPSRLARAEAIFVGVSESSIPVLIGGPLGGATAGERATTFKVTRNFKGTQVGQTITVTAGTSGAACGVIFPKDTFSLVYASEDSEGVLRTSSCSVAGAEETDYFDAAIKKLLEVIGSSRK